MRELDQIHREMGFAATPGQSAGAGLLYALARTFSLAMRELARVYQRFGLSAASFNLLMLLKHGAEPDSCTQQALGARLVVSPSDMTGLIDRLERKGLVKRLPGKDRRSHLLRITPKGAALLDAIWPEHLEVVRRLTDAPASQEVRTTLRVLAQVRQAATA